MTENIINNISPSKEDEIIIIDPSIEDIKNNESEENKKLSYYEKNKERMKQYYLKNREKRLNYQKEYSEKHKEEIKEKRNQNKEKINNRIKEYSKT